MDASIATVLQEAIRLHRQGALPEAVRGYTQVLGADPSNADAHYYLAVVSYQQNKIGEAIDLAGKALAIRPDDARLHRLAGQAQLRLGRNAEALASFDRAIAVAPDMAEAHGARADVLLQTGRLQEAIASYDRALALKPESIGDWCNRGAALQDLGRDAEALESFDRVIALQPDYAEAHFNRGNALARLKRFGEAVGSYNRAVALQPGYVEAFNNLGLSYTELGDFEAALASYDRALAVRADNAEAQNNRGLSLKKLGRSDEALAAFSLALAADPNDTRALANRAAVLLQMDRQEETLADLNRVLAIRPDDAEANWNKSLVCLNLGRLAEGWSLHRYRWTGASGMHHRDYHQPYWNGERTDGVLMVWSEQGLGDQILHAGAVAEARALARHVVLEAEPRLVPLFARSFPDVQVIPEKPELYSGPVDVQLPVCDLGQYFRQSLERFPKRSSGYLIADPVRTAALRKRLAGDGRRVIGLSWASHANTTGQSKSARLHELAPVLGMPGCRFIDLQYGDTQADRDTVRREHGFQVERLSDVDNTNDIDGLAALIAACDVVVTVSNTTAHLAGAVGTPTWVMVPNGFARIWYWFGGLSKSPWYPDVHVRRKSPGQSWAGLAHDIAKEVEQVLQQGGRKL